MNPILKKLFDVKVINPVRIFDNLGFAAYKGAGSIVINTSAGIRLVDSIMNGANGVKTSLRLEG